MEVRTNFFSIAPYIRHVVGFYDHPLSGVAVLNGDWYWFDRPYRSNRVSMVRVKGIRKFLLWYRNTLFCLMVGTHWQYKEGKRTPNFGKRRPRAFHTKLFNLYYKIPRLPFRIEPI